MTGERLRGWHPSASAYCASTSDAASPSAYLRLHDPHVIRRRPPVSLAGQAHWSLSPLRHASPETFVAVLPGARVCGRRGAIIGTDGKLLADVSREFRTPPERHSLLGAPALPAPSSFPGRLAVLAAAGGTNYYHWMLDVLPRIELLRLAGLAPTVDLFLVNALGSPFQVETLAALGVSLSAVRESRDGVCIQAQTLLVPSFPGDTAHTPAWPCRLLRRRLLRPSSRSAFRERLYVSRADAACRRVTNEDDVVALLSRFGFRSVSLAGLSVSAQARLFHGAELIVAPHGAALTNIVFCRRGARVVEFFSPNYVYPCYWSVAEHVGVVYSYLLGAGAVPPEGASPHAIEEDILVDTSQLEQLLRRVLPQ